MVEFDSRDVSVMLSSLDEGTILFTFIYHYTKMYYDYIGAGKLC